ncbi:hypothetical protein, partial [Flavobacterium plurextorum]|uniref:hypothetical protein n=1 Tax=Flavobacterium plurextorum TaxID=1114867 RepID=UPI001AD82905
NLSYIKNAPEEQNIYRNLYIIDKKLHRSDIYYKIEIHQIKTNSAHADLPILLWQNKYVAPLGLCVG